MQELVVPAGERTKGLENFLKKQFPIGYVRKLFRKNGARLNGRRAKAGDAIAAGDRIQLYIPFEAKKYPTHPSRLRPVIDIIYQDEALLVINKPAGLAVHEGRTVRQEESLAGWVEKEFRTSKFSPRLVHRLDKDTSGLLLLAKDEKTLSALEGQFETGTTEKEYLCLVAGRLPHNEGKIDIPLPGRDGNLVRALTRYRVLKRFSETTLVRVAIETGRLHQIRLHFAKLGYPVVMDDQHGDFTFNKRFRKAYGLRRQFLHAEKLAVDYAGKRLSWRAPLAQDLEKILLLVENH
jgi:23S rRNA pseudouridine955/2504/2580 synthase